MIRLNRAEIARLYTQEFLTIHQTADRIGCDEHSVRNALRDMGIETRRGVRFCWCGKLAEKRWKNKNGRRTLTGTMCRKHRLAHEREEWHRRGKAKRAARNIMKAASRQVL